MRLHTKHMSAQNNLKPERIVLGNEGQEDTVLDVTLRPSSLNEFVGQSKLKENLRIFVGAAKKRKQSLEHVLFYGPPGIGKTTLAHIIAHEMGKSIRVTSGPAIERAGDLGAILTNLEDGDILFIDEIHRLNRLIEEVLYPAMEEYSLDIITGKGPAADTVRLDLPHFTLVGATTKPSLLSSPLRDRFGMTYRIDFYDDADIEQILDRSSHILGISLGSGASEEIAKRSRKTPRIANRLLKRVRDFAEMKHGGAVTAAVAQDALARLEIDERGLDDLDRKILRTIVEKFGGGPVGVTTIAQSVAEDRATIEDVYEPFLMQLGFLARTSRGRVVTESGYRHIGKESPGDLQKRLI